MEKEKYFKCPKCGITRNIEEAAECAVCKDKEMKANNKRIEARLKEKREINKKI